MQRKMTVTKKIRWYKYSEGEPIFPNIGWGWDDIFCDTGFNNP